MWFFLTVVLLGPASMGQSYGPFRSEAACETARAAWLRAQTNVEIVELGPCVVSATIRGVAGRTRG
jgi:hypothetical protein